MDIEKVYSLWGWKGAKLREDDINNETGESQRRKRLDIIYKRTGFMGDIIQKCLFTCQKCWGSS